MTVTGQVDGIVQAVLERRIITEFLNSWIAPGLSESRGDPVRVYTRGVERAKKTDSLLPQRRCRELDHQWLI